jgi:hypothetical protein
MGIMMYGVAGHTEREGWQYGCELAKPISLLPPDGKIHSIGLETPFRNYAKEQAHFVDAIGVNTKTLSKVIESIVLKSWVEMC